MKTRTWTITCDHVPDALSRILGPIRRRGQTPDTVQYSKSENSTGNCTLQFDADEHTCNILLSNLKAISIVHSIETT